MTVTRREFCTYFDRAYLPRGLALYHSLRRHCPDFRLWTLCLDAATYDALRALALPDLVPIALHEFERGDAALQAAKANRATREYYFTCTPSWPLFLLQRDASIEAITYLDADLYFFASPEPVFDEIGASAIAIVPHRFPAANRRHERYGVFNVGWLTFRRSGAALACLRWWRERCIDWCFDRDDPSRYADQKYLDDWPTRFEDVHVIAHTGANVASWNLANYRSATTDNGRVLLDGVPLIFFHFHHVKPRRSWLFETDFHAHGVKLSGVMKAQVFTPYLRALDQQRAVLARLGGTREPAPAGAGADESGMPLLSTVSAIAAGHMLVYVGGRVR